MVRGGWRRVLIPVLAVGLLATGCVQQISGVGSFSSGLANVPDAKVPVVNTDNGPIDKLAGNAIADIQQFWTQQMPVVFNKHYQPVTAFYSIDPKGTVTAPCTNQPSDIRGNAFYCPSKDIVAWDRTGLFPELDKTYGPFLVAMVLAHEWGHAIQHRTSAPSEKTIVVETQADCYAGSWVAYALKGQAPHFQITRDDLDQALAGYLQFRDPVGTQQSDQQAHGSGFDRISAFQEGFEQGTKHCATFNDTRTFTEIPFATEEELANQGNMPYDEMLVDGPKDIADYWNKNFEKTYDKKWTPLAHLTAYDAGQNQPKCDGNAVASLEYCPANDTIYYDDTALQKIYSQTGDFGPITLIGVAYGQAVRKRLAKTVNGEDALLGSICLAGSYAEDVFPRAQPRRVDALLRLSPGDLDEALQSLLNFAGHSGIFDAKGTDGFDRVIAFQRGFSGIKACG